MTKLERLPKDKLLLQCDCQGDHIMQWLKWEDDPNDNTIYVSFIGTQISRFWERIKIAWRIIRWGEYENYGILLGDELPKLKEWIDKKI